MIRLRTSDFILLLAAVAVAAAWLASECCVMQALLDTIQLERAGHSAMASLAIAPSCSTTIDAHERGRASYRVLSRGHHVHVVSNQPKKGFFTVTPPGLLTLPPVDWRRFCRRPFPHSHWSRYPSSLAVTNRGVSSFARALPRVLFANGPRPTASVRNRLPHQRFVNRTADRLHSLSRLSYPPSFDGSKKPWKWRQELGKVIQGRGCFVQGGGCCD